jgi:phenylacetate-coenzyme A ligase PaaK-like adenylate-forming protein
MHRNMAIVDFRLEVLDSETLDVLKLQIELSSGADAALEVDQLTQAVRNAYEVTPSVELLQTGDLAQIFIHDVKAKRFVDSRRR